MSRPKMDFNEIIMLCGEKLCTPLFDRAKWETKGIDKSTYLLFKDFLGYEFSSSIFYLERIKFGCSDYTKEYAKDGGEANYLKKYDEYCNSDEKMKSHIKEDIFDYSIFRDRIKDFYNGFKTTYRYSMCGLIDKTEFGDTIPKKMHNLLPYTLVDIYQTVLVSSPYWSMIKSGNTKDFYFCLKFPSVLFRKYDYINFNAMFALDNIQILMDSIALDLRSTDEKDFIKYIDNKYKNHSRDYLYTAFKIK